MLTAWALLVSAIGVEVASTAALPRTHGFHDPLWSVLVMSGYAVSIWLLAVVIRDLPVAMAYAVWSGLGTAGIVVVGAVFLHQRIDLVTVAAMALIIVGVFVLNLHIAH